MSEPIVRVVPTLRSTIIKSFVRALCPVRDGALPYVYTKPFFMSNENRKKVDAGAWGSVDGDDDIRKLIQFGRDTMASEIALVGNTGFPAMPINARGQRVFVVSNATYDPDCNEVSMRIGSEVDTSFWVQFVLPIAFIVEVFSGFHQKRSHHTLLRCTGRVSKYQCISVGHCSQFIANTGNGTRSVQAALHVESDKPDVATIEIRAPHCPEFGMFVEFTANSLFFMCAMYDPDLDLAEYIEALKSFSDIYSMPEIARAIEEGNPQ